MCHIEIKRRPVLAWLVIVGSCVFSGVQAGSLLEPVDLTKIKPVSAVGFEAYPKGSVAVGGKIFQGFYGSNNDRSAFATWPVPKGYTVFEGAAGINDVADTGIQATLSILVDGKSVRSFHVSPKAQAVSWSIPCSAGQSIRVAFEWDDEGLGFSCPDGGYYILANPRLMAKPSGAAAATMPTQPETVGGSQGSVEPAPFVVDPNDLEKLAVALRKRVDGKPELKARIAKGQTALMTFALLDIPSQTVAANVAEDLYTSMINNDFPLVERGQLDKIMKELKIQDTALIDPKTAQKIGQLSGCDVILLGSISDRGQFVVINARLMETATGKSLAAERVEMRKIPINR